MATTSDLDTNLTKESLLARATDLLPALRQRAPEAERLRQLPEETARDLVGSRLVRIGNPPAYGGFDASGVTSDTMYDVAWELARACPSTAWCYSVWTVHAWITGHFSAQAQEEYWSTGPDTLASSAFNPAGAKAEAVKGGWRVSGRWDFSSGCDAAQWVMAGIPSDTGLWVLIPRTDYRIDDTWFTSGLRGTGSKDIVIEDAFVPSHRVLDVFAAGNTDLSGWETHGRLTYRVPLRVILGWDLAAPLIGMAQGVIDEFVSLMSNGSHGGGGADAVATQIRLSESSAEVESARTLHRASIQDMLARAERGDEFTLLERARYARNKSYIARLCLAAVNRLFDVSGGHALYESEPLQRFHRDVHAASHQMTFRWDTAAENYGRLALRPDVR